MIFKKIIVLLFLFVCVGVTAASAQWHSVGSKEIDGSVDHDTLNVTDWKSEYKHIRLGVAGAPVDFSRVIITYGSGITEEIWASAYIKPGEFSGVKDLATGVRLIRKIEIWYVPDSLEGQKATVTLFAR